MDAPQGRLEGEPFRTLPPVPVTDCSETVPGCAGCSAWNSLKLFCLYLTLFLSIRPVGVSVLSLWRVQLLGGLMHIIVSALPNVAGMGPAEFSFLLIFSRYMDYGQSSSVLILYRTATFFFPFMVSIFVFLIVQRRTAVGDDLYDTRKVP